MTSIIAERYLIALAIIAVRKMLGEAGIRRILLDFPTLMEKIDINVNQRKIANS
jgi:hypothetical protein